MADEHQSLKYNEQVVGAAASYRSRTLAQGRQYDEPVEKKDADLIEGVYLDNISEIGSTNKQMNTIRALKPCLYFGNTPMYATSAAHVGCFKNSLTNYTYSNTAILTEGMVRHVEYNNASSYISSPSDFDVAAVGDEYIFGGNAKLTVQDKITSADFFAWSPNTAVTMQTEMGSFTTANIGVDIQATDVGNFALNLSTAFNLLPNLGNDATLMTVDHNIATGSKFTINQKSMVVLHKSTEFHSANVRSGWIKNVEVPPTDYDAEYFGFGHTSGSTGYANCSEVVTIAEKDDFFKMAQNTNGFLRGLSYTVTVIPL